MEFIKTNLKYLLVLILLAGVVLVWSAVFAEGRKGLTVAFFDVGQGDAIFIQAENGNQVLLDAGPNKNVLRQLGKTMPFYDRSIDMIIESHPDADHIGGFPGVLKRYKVGLAMESGVNSTGAVYAEVKSLLAGKNIQTVLARKGMRVKIDEGLVLDILWPGVDVFSWDTNDASIVAKLTYGSTSFLLTGDSPQKIEKYLVSVDKENLDIDVLKVGHHGSKTSSAEIFIGYTSPEYAVISAGKDNRYGHPNQEVLDALNKFGVKILRTDEEGTIKFYSGGESLSVVK